MSDYETIQRRRNIIVGIFVIVALCVLVGLIYKFGDLPGIVSEHRSFQVFVQFPTAPGVQRDTPVRFCGYQIGRVTEVRPPKVMRDLNTGKFYHQTLVALSINRRYKDIPNDVEAKLMTRGLGSSYIELKLTSFDVNEPAGESLVQGSLLQGSTGVTSEFFPAESQEKLDELVDGLRIFINNTNAIVGDPNTKGNLEEILTNLADASQQAEATIEEFRKFAVAGNKTFTAMLGTSEELSKLAAQLRLILEKVNSGEGSAGKLVNDGRFYESLLENAQQMQVLLEELKSFVSEAREKGLRVKLK